MTRPNVQLKLNMDKANMERRGYCVAIFLASFLSPVAKLIEFKFECLDWGSGMKILNWQFGV